MSSAGCVIVGGGHAAAQLAPMLRQRGWKYPITVISDEPYLPYKRPPLSKGFLSGELCIEELLIKPEELYSKLDIKFLANTTVKNVDRNKKQLAIDFGEPVKYDKLILATGTKARHLTIPGAGASNVFYLRTIDDVSAIKNKLEPGRKVIIIGGGYIGLETAAVLNKLGLSVTVLEAMPRILQRVTSEEVSGFYSRVHAEEGVEVVTGVTICSIEECDEGLLGIHCKDGATYQADFVIAGIGVLPATELAEAAGLQVDNGIHVDEYARTADKDILAVGDCTWHFNKIYDRQIRLESVQNAVDQATVAANTLCGTLKPYEAVPWFWSDQYDIKLQIAGLSHGYDDVVIRGDAKKGRNFSAFYFIGERIVAVDAINSPREFMIGKKLIAGSASPDKGLLADVDRPVTEFLK
jgi:3-phenylpropionate/trans-cinnamate dioxygenase ferredoxin reductase subunit